MSDTSVNEIIKIERLYGLRSVISPLLRRYLAVVGPLSRGQTALSIISGRGFIVFNNSTGGGPARNRFLRGVGPSALLLVNNNNDKNNNNIVLPPRRALFGVPDGGAAETLIIGLRPPPGENAR